MAETEPKTCVYCDGPADTRDHIVPKITGINIGPMNIVPACRACNQIKGAMMPNALRAQAEHLRCLAARHDVIARKVEQMMQERGL